MRTITIKNLPDALYETLKSLAKNHQRSLNSELIYRIQSSVGAERVDPEKLRSMAREFRKRAKIRLSPEEVDKAINSGRE